jgi:hypothetical protein
MSGGDWSSAPDDVDVDAVDTELSRKMADQLTMRGLELDDVAMQRLREAAADMEEGVAQSGHVHQQVPFLCATPDGPVHANFELSRSPGNETFKVTLSGAGLPEVDPQELFRQMRGEMTQPGGGGVPVGVVLTLIVAAALLITAVAGGIIMAAAAG